MTFVEKGRFNILVDYEIGAGTIIWSFCNIYSSTIGKNCKIASHVEIGGSTIGDNCKIEAFVFIPPGCKIGNNCFIGPHVAIANDKYPRSDGVWEKGNVVIEDGVKIGLGARVLPNVHIGEGALIAACAVVTKNIPKNSIAIGHPAHVINLPRILIKVFEKQMLDGSMSKDALVKELGM